MKCSEAAHNPREEFPSTAVKVVTNNNQLIREILSSHRVNQNLIILRYGAVVQEELLYSK